MKPRFDWRHQYDNDRDKKEGDLAALRCEDESLTVQSFAPDADLNVLAKRFGITGIPMQPLDPSHFRDTTQDPDLRQILEHRRAALDGFRSLSPKIRKRFHNDPLELWHFINDPDNAEEAIRLGLLSQIPKDTPSPTAPNAESGSETTKGESPPIPPNTPQETSQKGT